MSSSWWSWNKGWWNSSDWTGWQQSQDNNYSNSRWYHDQAQRQTGRDPKGEFLGWRKRTDKLNKVHYEAKRSRFAELPSGARRTGAMPQTRRFDTKIEDVFGKGLPTGVIFTRWPVFTSSYADDPQIASLHDQNGTTKELDKPKQQANKPILFFMLSSAAQGARFKLRGHGTCSSQGALTIEGPPGVVQGIFQDFYQYTLRRFPHLATQLPMRPSMLDHVTDAETDAKMKDESSSNSAAGGCAPASSGEHASESHIDPNVHYESTDSENDDSEDIQEAELVHDDEVPDPDQESSSDESVVDEVAKMIQPSIDMLKKNISIEGEGERNSLPVDVPAF